MMNSIEAFIMSKLKNTKFVNNIVNFQIENTNNNDENNKSNNPLNDKELNNDPYNKLIDEVKDNNIDVNEVIK